MLVTTIVDLRADFGQRPIVSRGCPTALNRERMLVTGWGSQRRRMRMLANGGTHTAADVLVQYERQEGKCYYCHVALEKYHVEHRVPVSRGGSNGPENLVCACATCNWRKHVRTDVEFLAFLEVGAQKSDPL